MQGIEEITYWDTDVDTTVKTYDFWMRMHHDLSSGAVDGGGRPAAPHAGQRRRTARRTDAERRRRTATPHRDAGQRPAPTPELRPGATPDYHLARTLDDPTATLDAAPAAINKGSWISLPIKRGLADDSDSSQATLLGWLTFLFTTPHVTLGVLMVAVLLCLTLYPALEIVFQSFKVHVQDARRLSLEVGQWTTTHWERALNSPMSNRVF